MDYEQARFYMIEQQIRTWNVLDPYVLETLSLVKREDFVPSTYQSLAFTDAEIPLPCQQVMLAPKVEARLLQELNVQKHEKALEIGAGSGHVAALLGRLAQQVLSLEIEAELVELAQANLRRADICNVEIRHVDGAQDPQQNGVAADGLFDVILLSGSVAEVPAHLLTQLKVGGRLAAIVGQEPMMRATIVTRVNEAAYETRQPWDTVAPRLVNFGEPAAFKF